MHLKHCIINCYNDFDTHFDLYAEYCWICNKGNSRPVRTPVSGTSVVRGLRCAHPRLSPFGLRLWGHAFQATLRRGEASLSQMAQNGEEQQAPEVLDHA